MMGTVSCGPLLGLESSLNDQIEEGVSSTDNDSEDDNSDDDPPPPPEPGPEFLNVNSPLDGSDDEVGDKICASSAAGGNCTLRAAVEEAMAWTSNVKINLGNDTYNLTLSQTIDITRSVTIIGAGVSNSIIDGASNSNIRSFTITGPTASADAIDIKMSDLKIQNNGDRLSGFNGGSIYSDYFSNLTLDNVEITDSESGRGGGIYINRNSTLSMENGSLITNSESNTKGAGIYINNTAGSVTITDSTIDDCFAVGQGAGIYTQGPSLILSNAVIIDNVANNAGGGVYVTGTGANLVLSDSDINLNVGGWGGGVYVKNGANFTSTNSSLFSGNSSLSDGGAIFVRSDAGSVSITDTVIDNNGTTLGSGAGIFIESGATIDLIKDSVISNNSAGSTEGTGGIEVQGEITSIDRTLFDSNIGNQDDVDELSAGALTVMSGGIVNITNSRFVSNIGNNIYGIGAITNDGTLTLDKIEFTSNSGTPWASIYTLKDLTVTNSTFSGNTAVTGMSGTDINGVTLTFINCTFATRIWTQIGKWWND